MYLSFSSCHFHDPSHIDYNREHQDSHRPLHQYQAIGVDTLLPGCKLPLGWHMVTWLVHAVERKEYLFGYMLSLKLYLTNITVFYSKYDKSNDVSTWDGVEYYRNRNFVVTARVSWLRHELGMRWGIVPLSLMTPMFSRFTRNYRSCTTAFHKRVSLIGRGVLSLTSTAANSVLVRANSSICSVDLIAAVSVDDTHSACSSARIYDVTFLLE